MAGPVGVISLGQEGRKMATGQYGLSKKLENTLGHRVSQAVTIGVKPEKQSFFLSIYQFGPNVLGEREHTGRTEWLTPAALTDLPNEPFDVLPSDV